MICMTVKNFTSETWAEASYPNRPSVVNSVADWVVVERKKSDHTFFSRSRVVIKTHRDISRRYQIVLRVFLYTAAIHSTDLFVR